MFIYSQGVRYSTNINLYSHLSGTLLQVHSAMG